MSNAASEFEDVLNSIQGNPPKHDKKPTIKNKSITKSSNLFEQLIQENQNLDASMIQVSNDINKIRTEGKETIEKNLTFSLIFRTLEVSVSEYKYQSQLFYDYSQLYDDMCNEENVVRVLDLLRMIITDRRAILNDIMSNVLKIQKLDNDRIKMDNAIIDDEGLVDNLLSPDSL